MTRNQIIEQVTDLVFGPHKLEHNSVGRNAVLSVGGIRVE